MRVTNCSGRSRRPNEPIFDRVMLQRIGLSGVYMGTVTFAVFHQLLAAGVSVSFAQNAALLLMVLFENVQVFNSRSETWSIVRQGLFGNHFLIVAVILAQGVHIAALYNPTLQRILHLQPVTSALWAVLLGLALSLILVMEFEKCLRRWLRSNPG